MLICLRTWKAISRNSFHFFIKMKAMSHERLHWFHDVSWTEANLDFAICFLYFCGRKVSGTSHLWGPHSVPIGLQAWGSQTWGPQLDPLATKHLQLPHHSKQHTIFKYIKKTYPQCCLLHQVMAPSCTFTKQGTDKDSQIVYNCGWMDKQTGGSLS